MRLTDACVILGVEPRELGSREVVKAAHRTAMERYGQENKNSTLLEEAKTNIEDFWASLDRYEPNRDYSDKTENYLRRRDKEHQEFMIEMARGFRNERGELDEELLFCLEMLVRAHRTGGVKVERIQGELKIIFPADMLVAQNYHNEVMKKREAEEAAKREVRGTTDITSFTAHRRLTNANRFSCSSRSVCRGTWRGRRKSWISSRKPSRLGLSARGKPSQR